MTASRGHAARRRLLASLRQTEKRSQDLAGKVRIIVRDEALDIWDIQFSFEASSPLGSQLAEHSRRTGCPGNLLLELRFPQMYPADPPSLCIVRPRLVDGPPNGSWPPSPGETSKSLPLTFGGVVRLPELTSGTWDPQMDLARVLLDARQRLCAADVSLDSSSVRPYNAPAPELNLNATCGLPTVARCVSRFPIARLEQAAIVFPELALVPQGRVVLPQECVAEIYTRAFANQGDSQGACAIHMELKNPATGGRAFLGLAEAAAAQDSVVLAPAWILRQLFLREGDEVRVRVVSLPMCSMVRLQPHSRDFYDMVGQDARAVLQDALSALPSLTAGMSIPVDLPCPGGAVVRSMPVFVARLEAEDGSEILAGKLPSQAGVMGEIEVRVDFLPAADLEETGGEYKARITQQSAETERIVKLAKDKKALKQAEEMAREAAQVPQISAEAKAKLGDGVEGLELCFRLPNGKQLRRCFPGELNVSDLKLFLLTLRDDSGAPWQPAHRTRDADLTLASAFPRRCLTDSETVASIGHRSVVLVTECQKEQDEDTKATIDAEVEAVLYAPDIGQELCDESCSDLQLPPPSPAQTNSTEAVEEESTSEWSGNNLSGLPDNELRAMARAAGCSAIEVERCLDSNGVIALLERHQQRAITQSRQARHSTGVRRNLNPCQSVSSRPPRARPPSAQRPSCSYTDEQLAPYGLKVAQFLELPSDTRDAIIAAMGASASASPSSVTSRASTSSTASSVARVPHSSSSDTSSSDAGLIQERVTPGRRPQPRAAPHSGRQSASASPHSAPQSRLSRTPSPSQRSTSTASPTTLIGGARRASSLQQLPESGHAQARQGTRQGSQQGPPALADVRRSRPAPRASSGAHAGSRPAAAAAPAAAAPALPPRAPAPQRSPLRGAGGLVVSGAGRHPARTENTAPRSTNRTPAATTLTASNNRSVRGRSPARVSQANA